MPSKTTARVSAAKEIKNQEKHDKLINKYIEIIDDLTARYPVAFDEYYEKLVNFKTNRLQPIHRWFDYKQGYADQLVQSLIDYSKLNDKDYVLDPFTGVGTTQVSAQTKGVKSLGIDINPVAILAAKVKTHAYSTDEIEQLSQILSTISGRYSTTKNIPKYQKLTEIFNTIQLEQILKIKGFYEGLAEPVVRDFFRLAFISIVEPVSNRVKDGNGIKISRTKKPINNVLGYYEQKCQQMIDDLSHQKHSEAVVYEGSLLDDAILEKVKNFQVGSIIYSPPYANCFDYLEVYKMEVWLGGFVEDYKDFSKYRDKALRSHVNSKFNPEIQKVNQKVEVIADFIGTYNIWNRNIPSMLKGYFDDMHQIIERSYEASREGALCAIVVANSGYKGVIVPTDLLLVEIAEAIGYKLDKIIHARDIRSSSQQMVELRSKNGLMRESIILLRK